MNATENSITIQENGFADERILFTYSEEEKQQNEINENNAKLIFTPEFIPYRVDIKNAFDLSPIETVIYGFIRFYLARGTNPFYFRNDQIATVVGTSESTVEKSMSALIKKKIIKVAHRIKAGGGISRRVTSVLVDVKEKNSEPPKIEVPNLQKLRGNKNILKEYKENIKESLEKDSLPSLEGVSKNNISAEISEIKQLCDTYTEISGRSFKNYKSLVSNFRFWRESYSVEDMCMAIRGALMDDYWQDKIDPTKLLRRTDQKDNAVDRIGEFKDKGNLRKQGYMTAEELFNL